nr:MAG TPA: Protein of unknown function (DUF1441) [Caudoviricetes sp.]
MKKENEVQEDTKFIYSTADTCDFFSISRDTLSSWAKKGAPKIGRGKWNIRELMLWRYEQQKNVSPEARKLEADARYRELKAEMTEIQRDILNGKYIASAEVYKTLVECFGKIKSILLFTSNQIATDLSSQYPEITLLVKEKIDKQIERCLNELSKTGASRKK